jgi:hypothetical protein
MAPLAASTEPRKPRRQIFPPPVAAVVVPDEQEIQ